MTIKRLSLVVLRLSSRSPSRISFEISLAALEDCCRHRSHKIRRPFDFDCGSVLKFELEPYSPP
jgi:hypothetical protein